MVEDITEVFGKWAKSILDDVHTILPGQIETYYGHTNRKAKVKVMVKLKNANNQEVKIESIDDVPVIFPCSSNFNLLFPLKKGDGILLLFSEAAIGNYLTGQGSKPEVADDNTRFGLTDCIAIPGLYSFNNPPNSATTNIEIDETGKVSIDGNLIDLLGATESFIKGDTWKTGFENYLTIVSTQTGGNEAANAAAINAISGAAATLLGLLTNMLSTKIKGE
jgi:hypothetical protein